MSQAEINKKIQEIMNICQVSQEIALSMFYQYGQDVQRTIDGILNSNQAAVMSGGATGDAAVGAAPMDDLERARLASLQPESQNSKLNFSPFSLTYCSC